MPLTIAFTLSCATAACGPVAASAGTAPAPKAERVEAPAKAEKADAESAPTPVKMVAFDGAHDFMKTSRRLRVWREAVDFDMTVDAQGEATECKVINEFRTTYVNKTLCEVAMAHYTFEPARNARNEPVEGTYRAHIVYADLRAELD